METKYTLTIEQIQTIIENYKLGEYCKNNCYGCCGSDNYHSHCKDCVPKMKKHIEEMTSVTLEQVKKMWEELGYEWIENIYVNSIGLRKVVKEKFFTGEHEVTYLIIIDFVDKTYSATKGSCFTKEGIELTFREHQLLTKTFKALEVEDDPS